MNIKIRVLWALSCLAAFLAVTSVAHAASISGTAYCGVASSTAPTSAGLAGAAATGATCATFTASGIDFSAGTVSGFPTNSYTLGGFLTGNGSIVGAVTYNAGYSASTSLSAGTTGNLSGNVLMNFTGSAFFQNGHVYNVEHDDGINLYINSVLVDAAAGPTAPAPTPFTFTGATGTYNFQFIYEECCTSPAVFDTNLASAPAVPEPGSLALFGTGLLGLYGIARRRIGL